MASADGDRGVHRPPLPHAPQSSVPACPAGHRRTAFGGSGRMDAVSSPSPGPFAALPPQVDLPALEQRDPAALGGRQGLRPHRWRTRPASRSGSSTRGRPTANGRPGTHHIEARAFKDVFPRFKTMQGWHVPRRAGWDCHGLPVEIAVEQELGFAGKPDIERYGIAEFNARCRESVRAARRRVHRAHPADGLLGRHVHRLLDDGPQPTSRASGGRSSRSSTRACWSRTTGSRPTARAAAPGCPTTRSPRATRPLTDPSVYVRLPVTSGEWAGQGRPAGLDDDAVDAAVEHRGRRAPRRHLRRRRASRRRRRPVVVAEPLLAAVLGDDASARGAGPHDRPRLGARALPAARSSWSSSRRRTCPSRAHFVVLADYVTTEDGTGLVHQSPAFGADDLAVCRRLRAAGGQPDRPDRALPGRRPAGRRALLQGRRRRAGRGPEEARRALARACATSTAIRTAGAATRR